MKVCVCDVTYFVVEANELHDDRLISARVLHGDDAHYVGSILRVRVHRVRIRHDKARLGLQQLRSQNDAPQNPHSRSHRPLDQRRSTRPVNTGSVDQAPVSTGRY